MIAKHLIPRRVLQLPLRGLQTQSHRNFSIRCGLQQAQGKTNSQVISELAQEEGGPSKGSASAQLQSQVTKERNNQQGTSQQTGKNIDFKVVSEVAREEGGTFKGSESARLQSQLTKERNSQQRNSQQGNSQQGNSQQTGKSIDGQVISEVAREEGGTFKGSESAQLQSQVTKERNNQQGDNQQTGKTVEGQMISEVARQEGGPSKGSASAQLQSQVTKDRNLHQGTAQAGSTLQQNPPTSSGSSNPTQQSQQDRQAEYEEVASEVQEKIATDPASVTPEDGNLARSRETRAFGATEKGGVAATAQSLGSENAKAGRV